MPSGPASARPRACTQRVSPSGPDDPVLRRRTRRRCRCRPAAPRSTRARSSGCRRALNASMRLRRSRRRRSRTCVISRSSHVSRPVTRSQSKVPMPAASMARPQRSRSLSYCAHQGGQLELGDRRVGQLAAAWRRRRPTSPAASGPNTHSAPTTRPLVRGQRRAEVGADPPGATGGRSRTRSSVRASVDDQRAGAGRGHRAERVLQRALGADRRPAGGRRPRRRPARR